MAHTYLLPEYPPVTEAWKDVLPHSIRVEVETGREDHPRMFMFYRPQRPRAARNTLVMSGWSYEYDACGRVRRIDFCDRPVLDIYAALYNAVLSIGLFAQQAIDPAGVHFDLLHCTRGLLDYFNAKEAQLRAGLVLPFPSPLI